MSVDPDRLLFVLSARGSMKWGQYCEAVDFLSALSDESRRINFESTRSGTLQCLEALGHCNTCYDHGNSTIFISPPAFCRLPKAGLPVAVLTGFRTLKTRERLLKATDLQAKTTQLITGRYPGALGLLPDTIMIKAESEDAINSLCAGLKIHYFPVPPAWTLVNWSGTLTEYEATLNYRIPDNLNWARFDFTIGRGFVHKTADVFPRYSLYRNPTTGLPLHVFFRDKFGAEVDLNWGKYLFLKALGFAVTAYDEKRFRLCAPITFPFPALIARSLCLCSGKPPSHRHDALIPEVECNSWLMFEDVPPQIAIAALSKLGQFPKRIEIR
jgi:hypothetical protein